MSDPSAQDQDTDQPPSPVTRDRFDGVLFDLDGVLTTTRTVHAAAWKKTFDDFLDTWDSEHGTSTPHFDDTNDYAQHVDGKPRQEGVRDFLASRNIELPEGTPDSPPEEESIWGLGNRKQLLVESELEHNGVQVFPGSVAWVRELREAGFKTAVVSSSRNCTMVLRLAGITNLFDSVVDGNTVLRLGLAGKPAPDAYLEGARQLEISPARAVVVEDALAGVEAGKAGDFGLVLGVDRDEHTDELLEHGADVVVKDLSNLLTAQSEDVHRAGPPEYRLLAAAKRILAATGDYPVDAWKLVERRYNPDFVEQTETMFAVANGYLGIRGSLEGGEPSFRPATLLNGFHETWPIVYPEAAHGFATTGQTILPVPDGTTIRLLVDDEPITCERNDVLESQRVLDMQKAVLERTIVFQLPRGGRIRLHTVRFASLENRHLACIRYELTALDDDTHVAVCSELALPGYGHPTDAVDVDGATVLTDGAAVDPRQSRALGAESLEPGVEQTDDRRVLRTYRTASSGLAVAAGMDHDLDVEPTAAPRVVIEPGRAHVTFELDLVAGQTIALTKWLGYHYGSEDDLQLAARTGLTLDRARAEGYATALDRHEQQASDFWERSEIVWEGAPAGQQAAHFSLFCVLQATARAEGHGVPAKGLTGTGYEGHYFWDTEAYVVPFLNHTSPDLARSLLMNRVRMLPDARRRASEVGCKGALFPWRTINGQEASAFFEAGTAQYHIDADVAYAIDQYVRISGDDEFLFRHGTEVLIETARMWAGLGYFSDRRAGRFVINKVTGPDEYSTVVDNNLFTNLMAAENLSLAVGAVDRIRSEAPDEHARLVDELGITDDEVAMWKAAAESIYVPYDDEEKIHLQDDGFLDLPPWDFAGTPAECYPLLLHFHPLVIYRHQVTKQADVVLATVVLPDRFTAEQRRRIFEFYDPLTTGDSSLSECVQAVAAADAGKYRSAEEYLIDAAAVDIADTAGNVRDGIHVASAAGMWMALTYGFAGYRWRSEVPEFCPILPTRARRLSIPLLLRGSLLDIDIEHDQVTYSVRRGPAVTARHKGEEFTVSVDKPVSFAGKYHTLDAAPDEVA